MRNTNLNFCWNDLHSIIFFIVQIKKIEFPASTVVKLLLQSWKHQLLRPIKYAGWKINSWHVFSCFAGLRTFLHDSVVHNKLDKRTLKFWIMFWIPFKLNNVVFFLASFWGIVEFSKLCFHSSGIVFFFISSEINIRLGIVGSELQNITQRWSQLIQELQLQQSRITDTVQLINSGVSISVVLFRSELHRC